MPDIHQKPKYHIAALALTILIMVPTGIIQSQLAINRDVAFYMYFCEQALNGNTHIFADIDRILSGTLLSNFILYIPPSAASAFGIKFKYSILIYIYAVFVWSYSHLWRFCTIIYDDMPKIWILPPTFTAVTLLFPIDSFGQREHLFSLIIIPYLLATILELKNCAVVQRPPAIGLAALIAILIKPHFVALFVAVELVRLSRLRQLGAIFDPVNLIVTGGHIIYYGIIIAKFFHAGFDTDLVAWVLDLKRAYLNKSLAEMLIRKYSLLWLPTMIVIAACMWSNRWNAGFMVWMAAFFGGIFAALLQSLGVDYHWLIATVMAAMVISWGVVIAPSPRFLGLATTMMVAFTALAAFRSLTTLPLERGTSLQITALVRAILAAQAPSPSLLMINGDYGPLYPILGRTGFTNASSYHAYWFLDAMTSHPTLQQKARAKWIDAIAATTARDISERRPGLVLIGLADRPQYNLVTQDERVKASLADYRPAGEAVGYLLLRREPPGESLERAQVR